MKLPVRRTREVANDIIGIYVHIGLRNRDAAERVLDEIERVILFLSEWPGAGTLWKSSHPQLHDIRVIGLSKFRNYLIFYRVRNNTLELLRVLHGARDLERVIEEMQIEFENEG